MRQQGSVRRRGDTWTAYWRAPAPDGQRRQRSKGGFATRADARRHLTTVLSRMDSGTYVEPSKMVLAEYLTSVWLPSLDLREKTVQGYRSQVELWIVPALGGTKLIDITPLIVQTFQESLRGAERLDGRGPISDRTAQYIATVLRKALKDSVSMGLLPRDPAASVPRPRARRPEMTAWTAVEARRFLAAVENDRLHAAWMLLLARGLRRGELLGLRWQDVDLAAGRLAVRQTLVEVEYKLVFGEPKTAKGRRTLPLDETLVDTLRGHRRRQMEERLEWGPAYQENDLVFVREDGSPIHPQSLSSAFKRAIRSADVSEIRLHDLRHTCATLSLGAAIPTRVVADWLGHASTTITEDLYRHVTPAMMEEAGSALTRAVTGR